MGAGCRGCGWGRRPGGGGGGVGCCAGGQGSNQGEGEGGPPPSRQRPSCGAHLRTLLSLATPRTGSGGAESFFRSHEPLFEAVGEPKTVRKSSLSCGQGRSSAGSGAGRADRSEGHRFRDLVRFYRDSRSGSSAGPRASRDAGRSQSGPPTLWPHLGDREPVQALAVEPSATYPGDDVPTLHGSRCPVSRETLRGRPGRLGHFWNGWGGRVEGRPRAAARAIPSRVGDE